MNRRIWTGVAAFVCALVWGCDDDGATDDPPRPVELPADPDPEYSAGHFRRAQRGIVLDRHDVAAIQPGGGEDGRTGLSPEGIEAGFARVVFNRLLIEFIQCPNPDEASMFSPLAKSLADLTQSLARFDVVPSALAVNVALIDPNGKELLHVCLQRGAPKVLFSVPEHRENTISAFEELATLGNGLTHITVGVELNRYFHLEDADAGRVLEDDYTNLATLYREIYAAIKAVDSSLKVGPGLSWAFFRKRTVDQIVREYGLLDEDGELSSAAELEAIVRAYRRTIEPFLRDPNSGAATADYLGLSIVPFDSQAPFEGSPGPPDPEADPEAFAPIAAYYRHVRYVSETPGIPVVLARVDWPTPTQLSAGNKSVFLTNLKRALSHVDVEWVAWRRTTDIPKGVGGADACVAEMSLGHPVDYCFAGMLDVQGDASERGVLDNLLTDP